MRYTSGVTQLGRALDMTAPTKVPASPEESPAPPPVRRSTIARLILLLVTCTAIVVVMGTWYLSRGEPDVSLEVVWRAALGGDLAADDTGAFLVRDLRLPRLLLGLMAGAALALSGVIMQDALRNPIADPGLLGVSEAAAFAVALVIIFPGTLPEASTPLLALVAGIGTGALLVILARSVRDPIRLILIGTVLAGLYSTLTSVVLLLAPRGTNFAAFFTYTVGSVSTATWERLELIVPWVLIGLVLCAGTGRALNLLQLGDDMAAGLGMRVSRTRFVLLTISVLLVAPVVAVAGPISFVAFLCPHLARMALRSHNAWVVLPASAALGAVVVLLGDAAGRLLFYPREIPVGIWTILVAGPAAIWLAGSSMRIRTGDTT